jgi:hypothetical protein
MVNLRRQVDMGNTSGSVESWLPVAGYEGSYEVSDRGRVRSLARTVICHDGRTRRLKDRILRPTTQPTAGYLRVSLYGPSNGRRCFTVHGLVLTAFVGARPVGKVCCHGDGDPTNNRLANLRWDTYGANNSDAVGHGTHHQASKAVCPRGHTLALPNLVRRILPARMCLACARAHSRIHNTRTRRGLLLDMQETADAYYRDILKAG